MMLGLPNPWKYGTIALAVALAGSTGWGVRVNSLRADWQQKHATLDRQAQGVLVATQTATNNPALTWEGVPAQITALALSNLDLKTSIAGANSKVAAFAAETARLKASGDALRSEISVAQAARRSALDQLRAMAEKPGDRQNCPALLSQAQDALDLAYGSGL